MEALNDIAFLPLYKRTLGEVHLRGEDTLPAAWRDIIETLRQMDDGYRQYVHDGKVYCRHVDGGDEWVAERDPLGSGRWVWSADTIPAGAMRWKP